MQRRVGKGQAHIASPVPSPNGYRQDPGSDDDDGGGSKAGSGWNRKRLGVTTRIWLILALFLSVVAFTRYISPDPAHLGRSYSGAGGDRRNYIASNLKPKNYLNGSREDPLPFDFCPTFGQGDDLARKYGSLALAKTRLHLGSNARVQRVIHKALLGLPITISVLGGSVSSCHGAGDDPLSADCYPSRFFHWWNTLFPHSASELTNGAMRRINSDYFAFCAAHHIPDITDLVVLELDVDDTDENALDHFELLVRGLLLRKDQPAVVVLGHFSPQSQETYGFAGPDHWHTIVSQFYDVPHISTKPIIYPDYVADPSSTQHYFVDPVLASPTGHELLADVLASYFQSQICAAWNAATGRSQDSLPLLAADAVNVRQPSDARGLFGGVGQRKGAGAALDDDDPAVGVIPAAGADGDHQHDDGTGALGPNALVANMRVPYARINSRPQDLAGEGRPYEEIQPFCASANDLINPLPPSLFHGSGWQPVHPPLGSTGDFRVASHYWESTLPTSKLRIPISVGNGDIAVYYLREPVATVGAGSSVECWVDDNVAGRKTIRNAANVGETTPTLEVIDQFVSRGAHFVECVLQGEEGRTVPAFKVMGVFAD